jgi:hypothetical protein
VQIAVLEVSCTDVAVTITAPPALTHDTRPPALTDAMPASADAQVTVVGALRVVTTVAVSCWVCPIVKVFVVGDTAIETTVPIIAICVAAYDTQLVPFDMAIIGVPKVPPSVRLRMAYFKIGMVAA